MLGLGQFMNCPSPSFEQYVVRHDYRRPAVDFEQRGDVVDEIELLVAGGRPEVVPLVGLCLAVGFAFAVEDGDASLLAEGRVGLFVRHLQEQVGELLDVIAVADAVVAQHVAVGAVHELPLRDCP
jgi:hypothetical protein